MIKVYWKQAWELLKQNKLFSMLYIVGTGLAIFWLQTRTRREEVGVMLSFGATRSDIVRLLIGEGTVLTVVASLTGFLLYLQYALKEGLAKGQNWVESTESYWVSDFTSHYLLVSLVISPAEALRDE